jgi:uncharacterized protein
VIKASGKDARGNGTASATVTVTLAADGDSTTGSVDTDLAITGKPAQFGRGLISEVGGKILDSFASCLASELAPAEEPAAPAAAPAPGLSVVREADRAEAQATGREAGEAVATQAALSKPRLAAAPEPENEPIDLLAYAGPSVAKRLAPVAAGVVAVLVFLGLRRRRR